MQKDQKKLKDAGIQVVAISYDSVAVLQGFAEKAKVTYPLLSDSKSKVIDAFKIRNQKVRREKQEGIPHPMTFVLDAKGIVRAKLDGTVRKRHSTEQLLEAVAKMKASK